MTTKKYFRGIGPLWNINKLRKELEAALGQAVTCNVADDGMTLEIEFTVPGASNIVDQVVGAHIADAGFTIQSGSTGASFTNYGEFFYGTGAIEDDNATGLWGGFPAKEYPAASGNFWTLMQLNAGTLTWASNYLTGKQTSGAGAVTQDNNGIIIAAANNIINSIKWYDSTGTPFYPAYLRGYTTGSSPNRAARLEVITQSSENDASILVQAGGTSITLTGYGPGGIAGDQIQYAEGTGQQGTLHRGDSAGFLSFDTTTNEETLYTRTIKAGSLGPNGSFGLDFNGVYYNASGANRNITIRAYVGGTSGTKIFDSGAIQGNTGREFPYRIRIEGVNGGSASSQRVRCSMNEYVSLGIALGSTPSNQGTATFTQNTTSINSATTDIDIVVTTQFGTSHVDLKSQRQNARFFGPFYSA